jgi:hypothetical protein
MSRAILALSGTAIAWLPRSLGQAFSAFWHELTRDMGGPYRPERQYMRGPGPKWRAKHGQPQS